MAPEPKTSIPANAAAWQTGSKVKPLEVRPAPYTSPGEGQIVVKNVAVAINPVDWIIQESGTSLAFTWIKYPFIFGEDVAGQVVEVGAGVTRFKLGDRVLGQALGQDEKRNTAAQSAFQTYVVLSANLASPIPNHVSFEEASVIPLGLSTAACGMFQTDQLGLQLPSAAPKPTGKTFIVWGGSTSVGCNAIQLAVAAGYEVFTTASPRNFAYLKELGASQVFDYNSETVVDDMVHAMIGKTTAGAITMGQGAADACMDVLGRCKGDKFVSMATFPLPPKPAKRFVILTTAYYFLTGLFSLWIKSKTRGIGYKFILGTTLADNEVGKAIYEDYLPEALDSRSFVPAPKPLVTGSGLESIQEAMDVQMKGVSARKIVVTL